MSATILLADDSPTIQKVVELTFAETDYRVVAVSGGNELLARLPEVRPDVVICDVIMPDRDGYDVCQTIKSSPETLHIPVVLLTGTFEPFDRDRALAVGCDEIVTKPFEARQLIATVEKLVSGGGAEAPAEEAGLEEEEFGTYLVAPPDEAAPSAGEAEAPQEAPAAGPAPEAPPAPAEPAPAAAEAGPPAGPEAPDEIPEEGLDFTTTGFAEMEAAGQEPHVPMVPPEEGLEVDVEEAEPLEIPVPEREEAAQADGGPFEEASPAGEAAPAIASPSDTAPVEPPEDTEGGESWAEPAAPAAEPEPESEPEPMPEPEFAPEPAAGEPEAAAPPVAPAFAPEPPAAPETPAFAPEPPAAPETPPEDTAPAPEAPAAPGALSDEDVERIARRVLELYRESLERIAWEVIPDMAEIVVRERVRELEAEVERDETVS